MRSQRFCLHYSCGLSDCSVRWMLNVVLISQVILLLTPAVTLSQESASTEENQASILDAAKRTAIIETVIRELNEYYIFPEVAKKMEERLRQNAGKGSYDDFTELGPFIHRLTDDLRSVSNDLHIGVWPFDPAYVEEEMSVAEKTKWLEGLRYHNYGFRRIERLPGNIGYLELHDFEDAEYAGDTAVAVMNFLANSDALIIDLRRNGGGNGNMVNLICSYFFSEPVQTISIYSRFDDNTLEGWTQSDVRGPRMADIPICVLQSRRTASAAEHFSYALKALGRATVVGESSRGASNPAEYRNFPELSISIQIPAYRVTNPITGKNWEGTGVEPDIAVPAQQALHAACKHATAKLLETASDQERKTALCWALNRYEAELNPVEIESSTLDKLCGSYGRSYSIKHVRETLCLTRSGVLPYTLIPLGNNLFAVKEGEWRVRFDCDEGGVASELIIEYPDGSHISNRRVGK